MADRWHLHPADVDPRAQRPFRAKWFWWAIDAAATEASVRPRASVATTNGTAETAEAQD